MKKFYTIIFLLAVLMSSCGGGETFTVIATVDGLGTQNVRAVYRSNDKVNVVPSMALDGKFQFSGISEKPVLIDLYTGSRALIGHVIACNGETVEVSYKLNEPGVMTAKGDRMSEQLAKFVTANATAINDGDHEVVNKSVAKFVADHRDDAVALYIVLSLYDPSVDPVLGDSLVSMIQTDVKHSADLLSSFRETLSRGVDTLKRFEPIRLYTSGDSLTTIGPRGSKGVFMAVYGVSADESHDALLEQFNELNDSLKARVRVVELTLAADTAEWKGQIGDTKPRYTRCWSPGSVASPALKNLAIRRLPWFVAADSAGVVLYSGDVYDEAVSKVKNLL